MEINMCVKVMRCNSPALKLTCLETLYVLLLISLLAMQVHWLSPTMSPSIFSRFPSLSMWFPKIFKSIYTSFVTCFVCFLLEILSKIDLKLFLINACIFKKEGILLCHCGFLKCSIWFKYHLTIIPDETSNVCWKL